MRALPCRIQRQEHGHPYHGKVAMPATLLHKTPASTCERTWKADLRKDFIRLSSRREVGAREVGGGNVPCTTRSLYLYTHPMSDQDRRQLGRGVSVDDAP